MTGVQTCALPILLSTPAGGGVAQARRLVLTAGRLTGAADQLNLLEGAGDLSDEGGGPDRPLPRHLVDELSCVASWLEAEAASVRVLHCEGPWSLPVPRLPRFEPAKGGARTH